MKLQVLQEHLAALYLLDQIAEDSRTQVTGHRVEKKNNIDRYIF